ncbi:MAG: DUF4153 domain-containing protein [Saprospiraceae bacterium]
MKLPSLSILVQAFAGACVRFPAAMLCAIVGALSAMAAVQFETNNDHYAELWVTAMLGLALCTGLTALAEANGWSRWKNWGIQLAGLAYLAAYYFVLDINAPEMQWVFLPRHLGLMAVAHLLVAVAPYLNSRSVADFWEYNKQLFANFVIGGAYTLILYGGLALALQAVNQLFDLHISGKMYVHLFLLLAGVFQTTFFFHHFPQRFGFDEGERSYNIVFKNLCQYILIPIVGLYFFILYAYSIKIMVTWSLPHGWVSSLVLGFSVAGIFTYLINYLLPEHTDSKVVHAYRKWFWWVLLPMVGLLFVAIGRRIVDYGITPERYVVAHAGVWLLVMCAYFLWSKTDNIKFVPISLGLFVLVAVLGPFSAFSVSQRSQTAILQGLLEKNKRFENGVLKGGGAAVPVAEADRIHSSLLFLGQQNALDRIEGWFPVPLQTIAKDTTKYGQYNRATEIAQWLNAKPENVILSQRESVHVSSPGQGRHTGNIGGFRNYYEVQFFDAHYIKNRLDGYFTWLSDDRKTLLVYDNYGETVVDSFDMEPTMRKWLDAAKGENSLVLPEGADVLELRGKKLTARLFLKEVQFDPIELRLQNMTGILFTK